MSPHRPNTSNPNRLTLDRLVAGKVGFGANFTLDLQGTFLCHSTVAIVKPDQKVIPPYYLLGVLNSELFSLFCRHRMPTIGPGRHIFRVSGLKEFPLVFPDGPVQTMCEEVALLARELCLGCPDSHARTVVRSQIDTLTKALYGIT